MIIQHIEDKSTWPRGPWTNEPDRVEWTTRAGYVGLVRRGPSGALCGYVAIPKGHLWHGVKYDQIDAYAHGGLTYSDGCRSNTRDGEEIGICHASDGDDVWWIGFDCAHIFDVDPRGMGLAWPNATYKDVAFVRDEVEKLAEQIARAA